ncbi:MAG: hypothetical protein ACOCTG_02630 [Bacteroidota bacterium]
MNRLLILILILASIAVSACALLDNDRYAPMGISDYYNMYLPILRTIPHPDSSMMGDDPTLSDVRRAWSVNHVQRRGARDFSPGRFSSFATLWSHDLAQLTLRHGVGISDLSPDVQERMREEQESRYEGGVLFDVHVFVPSTQGYDISDTSLRGAGVAVELVTNDGNRYTPSAIEVGIVEQHRMDANDVPVLHRLNRVYFDRYVDDRDILSDVESIRLVVRNSGRSTDELWFRWDIGG